MIKTKSGEQITITEAYNRWKNALTRLSPAQYAHAKVTAYFWGTIGLIIGMIIMLLKSTWYFTIFLLAMIYLQFTEFRKAKQDYREIKRLQEMTVNQGSNHMDQAIAEFKKCEGEK